MSKDLKGAIMEKLAPFAPPGADLEFLVELSIRESVHAVRFGPAGANLTQEEQQVFFAADENSRFVEMLEARQKRRTDESIRLSIEASERESAAHAAHMAQVAERDAADTAYRDALNRVVERELATAKV